MDDIKRLRELRQQQDFLKDEILSVEQRILEKVPNQSLEGTTQTEWGSITNRLIRKLDVHKYQKIVWNLSPKFHFVNFVPKIDLKKLRLLEAVEPNIPATCVTTKPAKAVIKIK